MIRSTMISAALAATCGMAHAAPNILLVIADDMGLDASPCHAQGASLVRMPTLDSLCARGMVFDNAYTNPVCSPTRAAILTGKYASETGVGEAAGGKGGVSLGTRETSIFDLFRDHRPDYDTALIGKWHLSEGGRALDHPAELGVPQFFGPMAGGVKDYYDWQAVENGRSLQVDGYATTVLTDHAIDWIGAQDGPWFLWLAYTAPHSPFHVPPEGLHGFPDLSNDARSIKRDPTRHYFAALEALDTELGRLLSSLAPAERADTVVIFIGDNGTPGQVVRRMHGINGRGGVRAKGSIYDPGTHVPLVVAGPGVRQGRSDALVTSTDLFATIAGLAGMDVTRDSSASLLPVLGGGDGTRTHAYVEHFGATAPKGGGSHGWMIRDGRYALVAVSGEAPELFDMSTDPGQSRDLLAAGVSGASEKADQLLAARATLLK